jgi:hypothetical protein
MQNGTGRFAQPTTLQANPTMKMMIAMYGRAIPNTAPIPAPAPSHDDDERQNHE